MRENTISIIVNLLAGGFNVLWGIFGSSPVNFALGVVNLTCAADAIMYRLTGKELF